MVKRFGQLFGSPPGEGRGIRVTERTWKRQLLEGGPSVFASNGERKQREQESQEAELYEQIGRLKMELEWLKKKVARFDS